MDPGKLGNRGVSCGSRAPSIRIGAASWSIFEQPAGNSRLPDFNSSTRMKLHSKLIGSSPTAIFAGDDTSIVVQVDPSNSSDRPIPKYDVIISNIDGTWKT